MYPDNMSGGSVTTTITNITGNSFRCDGVGVYDHGQSLIINVATFDRNKAADDGGAIYLVTKTRPIAKIPR